MNTDHNPGGDAIKDAPRPSPFNRWRQRRAALLYAIVSAAMPAWAAQWRPEQPVTLDPPAAPSGALPADPGEAFSRAYVRSGRPRVMLMWNLALSDRPTSDVVDELVVRDQFRRHGDATARIERDADGSTRSLRIDDQADRTRTVTAGRREVAPPARQVQMPERHVRVLEQAFVASIGRNGLRLIDRSLTMRTTAARQRGGDRQLLEMDAMIAHADLLLEVLLVDDPDAPTGYGFDVRALRLRDGQVLGSAYSRGTPARPPAKPASWQAGADGYELRGPPPAPPPTAAEVGDALARDVMAMLTLSLSAAPADVPPRATARR